MADHPPKSGKAQTPVIPDGEDLPDLTPKQMAFVQGLLAGKTATDAYRDAYDTTEMLPATVMAEASRLRHNPKVEAWWRAGCIALATTGVVTKEAHIRRLEGIAARATAAGDFKTAVAAEHLIGKASGHYAERPELTYFEPGMTLMLLANHSPEGRRIAEQLAALFNRRLAGSTDVRAIAGPVVDPTDLPTE